MSPILRSQPQLPPPPEPEMPELAWILPPVSTNERAGYNERIRHCFRYEHSFKEKFCEISTSAKTHVLTRYKETIYKNVGPTHQYIFFKINAHSIYFLHVFRNNNLHVDRRYCLMTLFINPIGVHHVTNQVRCHAESRGVTNVTWSLSWMLSSDTLTSETYDTRWTGITHVFV